MICTVAERGPLGQGGVLNVLEVIVGVAAHGGRGFECRVGRGDWSMSLIAAIARRQLKAHIWKENNKFILHYVTSSAKR